MARPWWPDSSKLSVRTNVLCDSGDGSFCRKVPTKRTVPAVADVLDINPDPAGYTPMGGVYFAG